MIPFCKSWNHAPWNTFYWLILQFTFSTWVQDAFLQKELTFSFASNLCKPTHENFHIYIYMYKFYFFSTQSQNKINK